MTGSADSAPAAPRDATTVILVRPCADREPFELFMVKRHGKSAFMANAYVYPGGRLDDADSDPRLAQRVDGDVLPAGLMPGVELAKARALLIAGVREAFEEAGVLLAHRSNDDGRSPVALDDEDNDHWASWRERLHAGTASMIDFVEAEDLRIDLGALRPFAHWITPEAEPRRYDTWFVVARCPAAQTLAHDTHETVDSAWLTPAEALARYDRGELQLAPPTLRTLQELASLGSIEAVFERCETQPIPEVMPHFVSGTAGELVLLLPGDPDFPDPNAQPIAGATRIALREGRWWNVDAPQ